MQDLARIDILLVDRAHQRREQRLYERVPRAECVAQDRHGRRIRQPHLNLAFADELMQSGEESEVYGDHP